MSSENLVRCYRWVKSHHERLFLVTIRFQKEPGKCNYSSFRPIGRIFFFVKQIKKQNIHNYQKLILFRIKMLYLNDIPSIFYRILHCIKSSAVIADGISHNDVAVVYHPAVASFYSGFVMNPDKFRRDDYVVIHCVVLIRDDVSGK